MRGMCQKNQLKMGYVLAFNTRLYAKNTSDLVHFFNSLKRWSSI